MWGKPSGQPFCLRCNKGHCRSLDGKGKSGILCSEPEAVLQHERNIDNDGVEQEKDRKTKKDRVRDPEVLKGAQHSGKSCFTFSA